MTESFPDGLSNPADWLEVFNQALVQVDWNQSIRVANVAISSGAVLVLVANPDAPDRWFTGGWVDIYLPTAFGDACVQRARLTLNKPSLLRLPKQTVPLSIAVTCPRWLAKATIRVHQFVGLDDRLTDKLKRIEDYVD